MFITGCGNKECLHGTGQPTSPFRFDHLSVPAFFTKSDPNTDNEFMPAAFFCGVGIGPDNGQTAGKKDLIY